MSGELVRHFEAPNGDELAKAVEQFLRPRGREFVSLSYARTDPPNNVKGALLVYRSSCVPVPFGRPDLTEPSKAA